MDFLWCPKKEENEGGDQIDISGEYDSKEGSSLLVAFERCEGYSYCKTPGEIDTWLRRKFILTVTNEAFLLKDEFEESDRVRRISTLKWHVVSPQVRSEYVMKIKITDLNLQDEIWNVAAGTEEDSTFSFDSNS